MVLEQQHSRACAEVSEKRGVDTSNTRINDYDASTENDESDSVANIADGGQLPLEPGYRGGRPSVVMCNV